MNDRRTAKQLADRFSNVQGATPRSTPSIGDRETIIRDRKTTPKKASVAPFKYLYRTQEVVGGTTFYDYWVGGHSPTPIKLFNSSTLIFNAKLSNLAETDFILDIRLSDRIQSWKGTKLQWEMELAPEYLTPILPTDLRGYGVFTGAQVISTTTNPSIGTTYQEEKTNPFFIYKNRLTEAGFFISAATTSTSSDGNSSGSTTINRKFFRLPNQQFEILSRTGESQSSGNNTAGSVSSTTTEREFAGRNSTISPNGKHILFFRRDTVGNLYYPPFTDTSRFEDRFELYKAGTQILSPIIAAAQNGDSTGKPTAPTQWTIVMTGYRVDASPDYAIAQLPFLESSVIFKMFHYKDTWSFSVGTPPGTFAWKTKSIYLSNNGTIYTYFIPGENFSKTKKNIFEVSKLNGLDSTAKTYKRFCYPPHSSSAVIISGPSYWE